jgi:H+/Cl- antiporter ClcA
LCGLIGILTGLAGIFIDRIIQIWKDFRKKVKKDK